MNKETQKELEKALAGAAKVIGKIAKEINDDEGWSTDNLKDLEKAVTTFTKLSDACDKLGVSGGEDPVADFKKAREAKKKPVKKKTPAKKTTKKTAKKAKKVKK